MKASVLSFLLLLSTPLWAQTEKSFLAHKVDVSVMEEVVPEGGEKKGLQLKVTVTSQEHLINYKDLKVQIMVSGKYGGPKSDLSRSLERMVLNRTENFNLEAGKSFEYTTPVMSSGRDNPDHVNYGVFYKGYLVTVLDSFDKVVGQETNLKTLESRYRDVRDTPEGADFKAAVLVNR